MDQLTTDGRIVKFIGPETTFLIDLGEAELTIEEIWPNGDAPENPTAEDVAQEMRKDGLHSVLSDWGIMPEYLQITGLVTKSRATVRL